MASQARLDLSVPVSAATLNAWLRLVPGRSPESLQRISSYFAGIAGGPLSGSCIVTTGVVNATATITSTGIATAADTVTVANVELTAVASGAVPADGEWNVSAVVATQAASIALAINSVPDLAGIVTATSNAGIVTVTAVVPGVMGNGLAMSEAADNVTVTQFANGADGDSETVYNGYVA